MPTSSQRNELFIINTSSGSQYCHYGFQIDTYTEGCTHDCVYCYARDEGLREQRWNNPLPVPIDMATVRAIFETVFETDEDSPWRSILEARVPLRLGGYTDCFMRMEKHHGVTLELLKLLKQYAYPNVLVTRSPLVAKDTYMAEMDPALTVPQISIQTLNDKLMRLMEPRAPKAIKRLETIKTLADAGFRVAARVNPLFPIFPDGHYTHPDAVNASARFDYFSFELLDALAEHGTTNVITGFGHLSPEGLTEIQGRLDEAGADLVSLMKPENQHGLRGFIFSKAEVRAYYEEIRRHCDAKDMRFTTCYLGQGDFEYETHRDLWSNPCDCCDIKGCLSAFDKTALDIKRPAMIRANSPNSSWAQQTAQRIGLGIFDFMARQLQRQPETRPRSEE